LTLKIAKQVCAEFKKEKIPVFLTRETDKYVSIKDKVDLARKKGAMLFLAIHANFSNESECIRGVETHFVGKGSFSRPKKLSILFAQEKHDLAKKAENLVKEKMLNSQSLARGVQSGIVASLKGLGLGVVDRGIKSTGFRTLIQNSVPACIVETGFITNRKELDNLNKHFYRKLLAVGICSGVKNYIKGLKPSTS
jgi:N-acetylmuramoyl-L-alanine amidase